MEMTPEQALQNVAISLKGRNFQGTWEEHIMIDKSLQILTEAIKPKIKRRKKKE